VQRELLAEEDEALGGVEVLRIADVARYDHTDAYEHLVKVLDRAVSTPSARLEELITFVGSCRTIS
jgi:hypothetical protein